MRRAETTAMKNMNPVPGESAEEQQAMFAKATQALLGLLTSGDVEIVITGMKFEVLPDTRPMENPIYSADLDSGRRVLTVGYIDVKQNRDTLKKHLEAGGF